MRNVPPDPDESVSEHVEHFFRVNHPDHYLTHQVCIIKNHLLFISLCFAVKHENNSCNMWYVYNVY